MAKSVLNKVVVVVKRPKKVLSGRVAEAQINGNLLQSFQVRTNDRPKPLFKALTQKEFVAKLLEALSVKKTESFLTLLKLSLRGSFFVTQCNL